MALKSIEFSFVIPIYNEEESIAELVEQIKLVCTKMKVSYEVLFIDDGSTDKTLQILKSLSSKNRDIKVYSFRKNLGKSPALSLGFQESKGKYIVTLDGDLQDDPKNVPSLYKKLSEGSFDLVSGWRKDRKDKKLKIISSKLFNRLAVPFLFGIKLNDLNCGLKMYTKELAQDLHLYGGMHRFIPILANELGYSVAELPVVHHQRKFGYSKYKFSKILTDIPDLITIYFLTKYTRRPLHFFSKIGLALFIIGFGILIYLTIEWIGGHSIGRRPLLTFGTLFVMAGIQTIFTGLLADLIVNIDHKNGHDFPIKYQSQE